MYFSARHHRYRLLSVQKLNQINFNPTLFFPKAYINTLYICDWDITCKLICLSLLISYINSTPELETDLWFSMINQNRNVSEPFYWQITWYSEEKKWQRFIFLHKPTGQERNKEIVKKKNRTHHQVILWRLL